MIFFILGSHSELSIAELKAVLGNSYRPVFVSASVVVIEALDRNLDDLQERLAGIVKVGHVAGELTSWNKAEAADLIASLAGGATGKNKISFGLSVYDVGDKKQTRFLERDLDQLGLEVKKRLKQTGRPIRYVKGKEPRLSSAIVETNGLLASGGEFVLLACHSPKGDGGLITAEKILIGQTQAIQNFKAWSVRDYGRPARDAKNGMLPPKLARMMINLAGIDPRGASLLDPFCGSGTVLMEAALMGCETIIGSDISHKAVADTTKNMKWLTQHFGITLPGLSLHATSAAELPTIHSMPVDLLVTEVFLGTPRVKTLDSAEAHRLESELLPLFRKSFDSLATLLSSDSRAVVAFPAYKKTRLRPSAVAEAMADESGYGGQEDGAWHRLPLKSLLESLGYKVIDTYLYARPDQFVARDIYVLTRK